MNGDNKTLLYNDEIPIRWRDVDPYNIVNHSAYLTYMEELRWKWFYSKNLKKHLRIETPIVKAEITYKKPLIHPGSVNIKLYIETCGEKSWEMFHILSMADKPNITCAEALIRFVAFDPKSKRVVEIPEILKEHLMISKVKPLGS